MRKWSAMLAAGPEISLRPVRERTKQAIQALIGKPLTPELREQYLMRIFERTTEDDFDTLRELGLLVEADPAKGGHLPQPLPAEAREQLAGLLAALADQPKDPFKVCGPVGPAQEVLDGWGPVTGSARGGGRIVAHERDTVEDESGQLLRGLHRRPGDPARDAAHRHRGRPRRLRLAVPDPVRDPVVGGVRRVGRAWSRIRSRSSSRSTSPSARRCRTSRSTRWPTSVMPNCASTSRSCPATRCRPRPRSSGSSRTPTARAASSTSARPRSTSAARWRWTGPAGSWCTSATSMRRRPRRSSPSSRPSSLRPISSSRPGSTSRPTTSPPPASRTASDDYEVGEKIDHVDGVTLTDTEHQLATRLWQNTAKVHFNVEARPDGNRLIYGGHIISMARALSYNGLANAQIIAGDQRRRAHVAGLRRRHRLRVVRGARQGRDVRLERRRPSAAVGGDEGPGRVDDPQGEDGKYADGVLLDLDYWALVPR